MPKNTQKPQFSAHIKELCNVILQAQRDYEWNKDEVGRLDRLTQDYLHKLELEHLNYGERAKLATQLAECRRTRRASKDTTEILEPLVTFLESEKGRNMVNLLRETLGKMRKVEERMENRTYRYKILGQDVPDDTIIQEIK